MNTLEPKFKTGDVVRLKSGGPLMTVGSIPSGEPPYGPRVEVVWARNERLRHEAVPPETLVLVTEHNDRTECGVIEGLTKQIARLDGEVRKAQEGLSEEACRSRALEAEKQRLESRLRATEDERLKAYEGCERANARTRDAEAALTRKIHEATQTLRDQIRDTEVARQQLADDMTIVSAQARDFRALAAKLVELDRENLPVDVKSLIAEARLAVSR